MSDNINLLAICVQARTPVLIEGLPGIGKSARIAALAEHLGAHMETVIASIREPSDFGGLPVVRDDGVELVAPRWAQRLAKACAGGALGIAFLDEISTATPACQAALLRVILEGVVGDAALPPSVAFVAACNPADVSAGGWDLSAPLANRFVHLPWVADAQEWCAWLIGARSEQDVPRLPTSWRGGIGIARSRIAGFVSARPHLVCAVPKEESVRGKAWPSPRSWTMAADLIAASRSVRVDLDGEMRLVAGCVGDGAAMEYLQWERAADLPDSAWLLAHPESFVLPSRGDLQYAVIGGVVAEAIRKITPGKWQSAWRIMSAAAMAGAVDIAANSARILMQHGVAAEMPVRAVFGEIKAFGPMFAAMQS